MRSISLLFTILFTTTSWAQEQKAEEPPRQWIDKDTGHRVVRLSDLPGSRTLYFHDNAYTPEGDKFIFTTPAASLASRSRRSAPTSRSST